MVIVLLTIFSIFVPAVPLRHSNPPGSPPVFWPRFYGSITYYFFGFGTVVNGIGTFAFNLG